MRAQTGYYNTLNEHTEILGHKTLAMVKRYTHLSNETQRQALAKLAELCK